MSVSASEIEKAESRAKASSPRQYTEEYRLEAVEYCRKAREADPKKSIRECAAEPGTSDKAVVAFGRHLERPDKFGPFFFTEFQPLQLLRIEHKVDG